MTQLYPYQEEGAAWLAGKRAALLADEMGLGKSAQAIVAASYAFDDTATPKIGVICPASVRENWRREFAKFWPNLVKPDLFVESYDEVARNPSTFPAALDYLILDEAHYLKSPQSKRTRVILGEKCDGSGLVANAKHVVLLTGTPMPNDPSELWPALRALFPEAITGSSGRPDAFWQYVKRYCKTIDNGFGLQIVGAKNHEKLRDALKPFMLRRTKDQVLDDLPSITFDELYVEGGVPAELQGAEIRRVAEALDADGVDGLRKIAPHVATLRRLTGMAKVAPVVEWVKDFLANSDRKIVLFAQHRDVIDALRESLLDRFTCVVDGHVPPKQRQRAIDEFQLHPDFRVFIGQLQAAGTGITLTAASDVLFVESSWVPAENSQAAMRVHRIGQKNACMIRFATLAGSIDERIQQAVRRKTADITRVLDDAPAVPLGAKSSLSEFANIVA